MADIIDRNRQVNFKTNEKILKQAKTVFEERNLNLTSAINLFLETVAQKKTLPFETKEELEKEKLVLELRSEIQKSWDSFEKGKGLTIEEARERLWNTK